MQHTPVKSSVVTSVGYDRQSHTLEITFHTGKTYVYANVPPRVHEDMMNVKKTKSVGAFLHTRIVPQFKGVLTAMSDEEGL